MTEYILTSYSVCIARPEAQALQQGILSENHLVFLQCGALCTSMFDLSLHQWSDMVYSVLFVPVYTQVIRELSKFPI